MLTLTAMVLAAAPLAVGSDVARLLGQEVEVEGVLERLALEEGPQAGFGTGLVLDDDTVVYVTYGAPPKGWEADVGFTVRVTGRLSPSIGDREQSLIAPHLREYGAPKRVSRKVSELAGRRVRLAGVARDAKGGAVLLVEDTPIYLVGLERWPAEVHGKRVAAGGTVALTQHLPEAKKNAKGEWSQGASGKQLVLQQPTWRVVQTP